jgi:hypothetical protein
LVIVKVELTGKVNVFETPVPFESITVAVKVTVPALGGVPVSKPPELRLNPEGNPVADQTYPPLPPDTESCCE